MGQVQRLTRGQVKPYASIPRIDWSHPLAKNLIFYGYDIGGQVIDLVRGTIGTNVNTNVVRGMSQFGPGVQYPGTGIIAPVEFPHTSAIDNVTAAVPYSFAAAYYLTSAPGTGAGGGFGCFIFGSNDGGGFTDATIDVGRTGTADVDFCYNDNQIAVTGLSTVNKFHTALGVATGVSTQNNYFDGTLASTSAVNPSSNTHTAHQPVYNEYQPGGASAGNGVPGFVYYGALWSGRALTAQDAQLLHQDPYCFLIYPEDDMFMVGASIVDILMSQIWL
jgi:hypothetical protein